MLAFVLLLAMPWIGCNRDKNEDSLARRDDQRLNDSALTPEEEKLSAELDRIWNDELTSEHAKRVWRIACSLSLAGYATEDGATLTNADLHRLLRVTAHGHTIHAVRDDDADVSWYLERKRGFELPNRIFLRYETDEACRESWDEILTSEWSRHAKQFFGEPDGKAALRLFDEVRTKWKKECGPNAQSQPGSALLVTDDVEVCSLHVEREGSDYDFDVALIDVRRDTDGSASCVAELDLTERRR